MTALSVAVGIALADPAAAAIKTQTNIEAQGLGSALREFAADRHLQILYTTETVANRQTPGAVGEFTVDETLTRLLGGTGLVYRYIDENTITIMSRDDVGAPQDAGNAGTETTVGVSSQEQDQTQSEQKTGNSDKSVTTLQEIVVLGSLIPRTELETASPLVVITADEIKSRGYSSVADALQQSSLSTGAVENAANYAGSGAWAAKQVSLFGLRSSYTKILLDGRPMPAYSQIIEGSLSAQLVNNLTGVPIDMIERIEILPGGQSSLYGSDALAGVINIVTKKDVSATTLNSRYEWYEDGGGGKRAFSAMTAINHGDFHLSLGAQYEKQRPVFEKQRKLTAHTYGGQPFLNIIAANLGTGEGLDPSNGSCSTAASLWGGTTIPGDRNGLPYCGSLFSDRSIINQTEGGGLNLHASSDVNARLQLYSDLYYTRQKQERTTAGASFWFEIFQDQNLGAPVLGLRNLAPEERASGLPQKQIEQTWAATVGGKGGFAEGWEYDLSLTYGGENTRDLEAWGRNGPDSPLTQYLLGEEVSPGVYAPADYSRFYSPIPQDVYVANTLQALLKGSSRTDQLRTLVTQKSLFQLPGGAAGLAVVLEAGRESWEHRPGDAILSGEISGYTTVISEGSQDRVAGAMEWRLPLLKWLTLSPSARYDQYDAEGVSFSKPTYALGLELRPVESLLLRGKYGTSFKAPSLIDQFEGLRVTEGGLLDYARCAQAGFSGDSLLDCPFDLLNDDAVARSMRNQNLGPINGKSWSYGLVWSPTTHFSASVDYQHLDISGEVLVESYDYVLQNEAWCRNGTLDEQSPTCRAAFAQVIRNPAPAGSPAGALGDLAEVNTTKVNLARTVNDSIISNLNYEHSFNNWGTVGLQLAYTNLLKSRQKTFPGDPEQDYLRIPTSDYKSKVTGGVTWEIGRWTANVYGIRLGRTPNAAAQSAGNYSDPDTGKMSPYTLYNAGVSFRPSRQMQLALRVNNLFDTMPEIDRTSSPFDNHPFSFSNYNVLGRQFALEAKYNFAAGD